MAGVSFSVTGEHLTSRSRDMVLSGRWREALDFLKGSLEGFSTDHALSVLKGEATLTGSSRDGVFLDDGVLDEDYKDDLLDQYGGLARIDGSLYRPYLVVADYGPEDHRRMAGMRDRNLEFISESMQSMPDYLLDRPAMAERAMHYVRNRAADVVEMCKVVSRTDPGVERTLAVAFSPAGDVPLWVLPEKSVQAAVDRRMAELEWDGFSKRYGSDDLSIERDPVRMKNQAKMNFAEIAGTSRGRDMRQALDENLKAQSERSTEVFDERRKAIMEQNARRGFGLRRVDFGGEFGVREIPEGPLVRWALARTLTPDLAPEWDPVCPQGVKMMGDDPVHSDWVVGAGLEASDAWDRRLQDIQLELMQQIQKEWLGFETAVLVAGRETAIGTIVFAKPDTPVGPGDVAVIANAGPQYMDVARNAAAVIALKGGAMSHLAVNGLEEGFLILRDPHARRKFREGDAVRVDARTGLICKVSPDSGNEPSGPKP